jgi:hypothetical protein
MQFEASAAGNHTVFSVLDTGVAAKPLSDGLTIRPREGSYV